MNVKASFQEWFDGDLEKCPIGQVFALRFLEWDSGKAVMEFDANERFANPAGALHGGVLADIADGAMGTAFASTMEEDETFTNTELKINFLRPVWKGRLRFVGRVVHRGRNMGYVECDITDEKERLVARASTTCVLLRGDQAAGR